ncbi:hypothetical protein ABZ135_29470, partial [Streptomyces sp. NPDC006339]|uniref:hypothetical protein n=1 Tax=Streptomyces sp. NPDC006339 TaxID=3156755 RepID=UPI0033A2575F
MNSKRVDAAAAVLLATVKQGKTLPVSWAYALESACLLQSPETAAELLAYQSLELGAVDGRVSAACGNSEHPTWLRGRDDTRGCPWCRVAELEAERHSTNETLNDAMVALAEARDRIAELEALKPAPIQTCGTCGAGYTYGQSC